MELLRQVLLEQAEEAETDDEELDGEGGVDSEEDALCETDEGEADEPADEDCALPTQPVKLSKRAKKAQRRQTKAQRQETAEAEEMNGGAEETKEEGKGDDAEEGEVPLQEQVVEDDEEDRHVSRKKKKAKSGKQQQNGELIVLIVLYYAWIKHTRRKLSKVYGIIHDACGFTEPSV